jgi:archaellum component FlaC
MTIDERLDRLTERHEALTLTVEIIAANLEKVTERLERLSDRVDAVTAAVAVLVRIVEAHERRLDNLDNPGNLPPSPN